MIRAIVFDMDGVLVDAKDWHYEALNKALRLFGYEINRYEHVVTFDGLPTRKKLELLSKERGLPTELHDFLNELKQKYTIEITHLKCKPNFQHEYALSRLKADKLKLAMASNSIRDTVDLMLHKTNLLQWFDITLSNQDIKNPKPAPDIYLEAAKKLGLPPEECLVVEDNEKGIKAAEAAGCPLMIVRSVDEVSYGRVRERIAQVSGERK